MAGIGEAASGMKTFQAAASAGGADVETNASQSRSAPRLAIAGNGTDWRDSSQSECGAGTASRHASMPQERPPVAENLLSPTSRAPSPSESMKFFRKLCLTTALKSPKGPPITPPTGTRNRTRGPEKAASASPTGNNPFTLQRKQRMTDAGRSKPEAFGPLAGRDESQDSGSTVHPGNAGVHAGSHLNRMEFTS